MVQPERVHLGSLREGCRCAYECAEVECVIWDIGCRKQVRRRVCKDYREYAAKTSPFLLHSPSRRQSVGKMTRATRVIVMRSLGDRSVSDVQIAHPSPECWLYQITAPLPPTSTHFTSADQSTNEWQTNEPNGGNIAMYSLFG